MKVLYGVTSCAKAASNRNIGGGVSGLKAVGDGGGGLDPDHTLSMTMQWN